MPINIDGNGSIGGLVAGGLPDATVTPSDLSQPLTLMTAQNATGTSIDFTGIPSWVKRITVMFNGVSTNGTSPVQVQIGAGGVTATGYVGGVQQIATTPTQSSLSTGFLITQATSAANTYGGQFLISAVGSNVWSGCGIVGRNDGTVNLSGGSVTLPGTLDRVRITTVNGTDTFDAGSINVMYEG